MLAKFLSKLKLVFREPFFLMLRSPLFMGGRDEKEGGREAEMERREGGRLQSEGARERRV